MITYTLHTLQSVEFTQVPAFVCMGVFVPRPRPARNYQSPQCHTYMRYATPCVNGGLGASMPCVFWCCRIGGVACISANMHAVQPGNRVYVYWEGVLKLMRAGVRRNTCHQPPTACQLCTPLHAVPLDLLHYCSATRHHRHPCRCALPVPGAKRCASFKEPCSDRGQRTTHPVAHHHISCHRSNRCTNRPDLLPHVMAVDVGNLMLSDHAPGPLVRRWLACGTTCRGHNVANSII